MTFLYFLEDLVILEIVLVYLFWMALSNNTKVSLISINKV